VTEALQVGSSVSNRGVATPRTYCETGLFMLCCFPVGLIALFWLCSQQGPAADITSIDDELLMQQVAAMMAELERRQAFGAQSKESRAWLYEIKLRADVTCVPQSVPRSLRQAKKLSWLTSVGWVPVSPRSGRGRRGDTIKKTWAASQLRPSHKEAFARVAW
jgi:hypothetical protein